MGEIVNLRQVKKQRQREQAAKDAAAARAEHGRTLAERQATLLRRAKAALLLEGLKLDHGKDDKDA